MVHLSYYELYLSNINCNNVIVVICSIFFPSDLYHSNIYHGEYVRKYSIHRSRIRSGIFRVRISMALYSLQDSWQIDKALFLQTSWLTKIERGPEMATDKKSTRIRRRTKSLKMKTNPLTPQIIESERIIKRDGFSYFMIMNE